MSANYSPQDYWDGLLGKQFDESGVAYQQMAPSFSRAMYDALESSTSRLLSDYGLGGRPGRVLDIGSGTGIWVDYWRAAGADDIEGVDLTEVSVQGLRSKYPELTFHCADIGGDALPVDEPFDFVSAMSVLLHVVEEERWRAALRNIAAALRPGGHVVLTEPILAHGWNGPPFDDSNNSRARPLNTYRDAVAAAGLTVLDVRPATVLLANPIDSRRPGTHKFMQRLWLALNAAVGRSDIRGRLIGSTLKAIDPLFRRAMPYGPSAKLVLLRKD